MNIQQTIINAPASVPSLSQCAVLSVLSMGMWTARKADKNVTATACRDNGADDSAGKFIKELLDSSDMAPLRKIQNQARALHYKLTMPWAWKGPAILPVKNFDEYCESLDLWIPEHDIAANDFVSLLPQYIAKRESALNGMFNPDDYPSADAIKRKLRLEYRISPIADPDDIRVNMTDSQKERIRQDERQNLADIMAGTTLHIANKVIAVVGHMAESLKNAKPAKSGKMKGFHDSLVGNVAELAGVIDSLNIADDPRITDIAKRIRSDLLTHDATALKESDNFRTATADKANSILADVAAIFA